MKKVKYSYANIVNTLQQGKKILRVTKFLPMKVIHFNAHIVNTKERKDILKDT